MLKHPDQRQQRGVVLLLMLLVLVVTTSSFLLAAINSGTIQQSRLKDRVQALQAAKESLLAYALQSERLAGEGPGKLPCPDSDNDGLPDCDAFTTTTGTAPTARLPTLTPVISDAFTSTSQPLWYAVSPDFMIGSDGPLNTNTLAQLTVNNQAGYIAALIAPGPTLGNQTALENDPAQYLEQQNVENGLFFSSAADNPAERGNDIVLGITHDDLFLLLLPRVTEAFRAVLSEETELPETNADFHCTIQSIQQAESTSQPVKLKLQWLLNNAWIDAIPADATTFDHEACIAEFIDTAHLINYHFNDEMEAQISFQSEGVEAYRCPFNPTNDTRCQITRDQ